MCCALGGTMRTAEIFWIKHWRRSQNVAASRIVLLCEPDCSMGRTCTGEPRSQHCLRRNLSTNELPGHPEPRILIHSTSEFPGCASTRAKDWQCFLELCKLEIGSTIISPLYPDFPSQSCLWPVIMLRVTWELTARLTDGESHLLSQYELSVSPFITDQINCKVWVRANTGKVKDNSDRTRSTGTNWKKGHLG